MEQRNFLAFEYHKRKGKRNFKPQLIADFRIRFPGARRPSKNYLTLIWKKQMAKGTINNCNSKSSPGPTYSGRRRTRRDNATLARAKAVMDRDAVKQIGERDVSPVSTARRNALGIPKSSWSRVVTELRYHPYKPIARHQLLPADLPRRLDFCNWIVSIPDQELMQFLFSDEANFQLCGHVNSQNVRRYAPLKRSDPVNGGRPGHFFVEKRNSPKVMVFCGVKADGLFGFKIFENQNMNGELYHTHLQHRVFPFLRETNGGTLDGLYWAQDGAPCHTSDRNMRYLDRLFGDRVISHRSIRGRDWPARSPDLNPLDFCVWGLLKSKVYTPKPRTLEELRGNITREVGQLDQAMLNRAILDVKARCQKCIAANGGYFE